MKYGNLALIAATFALCALGGATWGCDPCDCPSTPERPPFTGALSIRSISWLGIRDASIDAGGARGSALVTGTLEVVDDNVVIRYREYGVREADHRIVYRIAGVTRPW